MESRDPADDGARRRDLILVSAFFHAPPPGERVYANCERVLRHALIAAGQWDDELQLGAWAAFQGMDKGLARFPVIGLWYSTLIELVRREPSRNGCWMGMGTSWIRRGPRSRRAG